MFVYVTWLKICSTRAASFMVSLAVHGVALASLFALSFLSRPESQVIIPDLSSRAHTIEFRVVDVSQEAPPIQEPGRVENFQEREPAEPEIDMPALSRITYSTPELSDPLRKPEPVPSAELQPERTKVDSSIKLSEVREPAVLESSSDESTAMESPSPVVNPTPAYPRLARRMGYEGSVVLSVRVTVEGKPAAVTVKTSSGHKILDDAAVEAVRRWVFAPARRRGTPLESVADLTIRFVLEETRR